MLARAESPDEADGFDLDVELEALEASGYVFAEPVVERALEFYRLVRAVGFAGAMELGSGAWDGWEASFLPMALAAIAEAEERGRLIDSAASLRSLFGGSPARA